MNTELNPNVIPGYQDASVGDVVAKTLQGIQFVTPSGGGTWGSITGTLSDQTDLQTELNNKEKKIYKQANAPSNPSNGDLWIDTDENSIVLPTPTQADSGKVVMVDSNGAYVLSNVINAEDQQY